MLVRTFLNAQFAVSSMLGISRSTGPFGVICPLSRDQDTLENIVLQTASPGPTLPAEWLPCSSGCNSDGLVPSLEQEASLNDLIPQKLGPEMRYEHQWFPETGRNPSLQHGGRPLQYPRVNSPGAITQSEFTSSILEAPNAPSSSAPHSTMLRDALLQIERQLMDDDNYASIQALLTSPPPQKNIERGVSSQKRPLDSSRREIPNPDNGDQNSKKSKRPYAVDHREEQLAQGYPPFNKLEHHNPPWSSSADQSIANAAAGRSPESSRQIRELEHLMATQARRHTESGPIETPRTNYAQNNIVPHLNGHDKGTATDHYGEAGTRQPTPVVPNVMQGGPYLAHQNTNDGSDTTQSRKLTTLGEIKAYNYLEETFTHLTVTDSKRLAWIGSFYVKPSGSEELQVQRFEEEFLQAIRQAQMSGASWLYSQNTEKGKLGLNSQATADLKDLITLIWCINGKLIEAFHTQRSAPLFEQEQANLQKWLRGEIIAPNKISPEAKVSNLESEKLSAEDFERLRNYLYLLLYRREDRTMWNVWRQDRCKKIVHFRPGWASFTRVALKLIISYYRVSNAPRWGALFDSEEHFIQWLSLVRKKYYFQFKFKPVNSGNRVPLLPWKIKSCSSPEQNLQRPMFYKKLQNGSSKTEFGEFLHMVKVESEAPGSQLNLGMVEHAIRTYVWIAADASKVHLPQSILENIEMKFQQQPSMYGELSGDPFHAQVSKVASKVWNYNHRFLEMLGADPESEAFNAEQIFLQTWLLEIFDTKEEYRFQFSNGDHNRVQEKQDHILDTIIHSHRNFESEEGPYQIDGYAKPISNQDAKFTKAAVHFIGSYYKHTCYEKWRQLFDTDQRFLSLLVTIRNRISVHHWIKTRTENRDTLKDLRLIPWKGTVFVESMVSLEKIKTAFSPVYTKSLTDITPLEKIQQKTQDNSNNISPTALRNNSSSRKRKSKPLKS